MRGFGLCPRILTISVWASGLFGASCGDPPLCQSDVFVAFRPTMITADGDAVAPGVQTDVHIRTSLQAGDLVTLEVFAEDGTSLGTIAAPAAADGSVSFTGVSVPAPRAVLRATGRGTCGEGRDEITVDVLPGAACAVQVTPDPEVNQFYAPRGVLNQHSDPDPATPGYQATVRVVTRPGWRAELFRTTTSEQSLGVITADDQGIAALPVTVLDGQVELRATCRGAGTELASPALTLFADTTAPTCDLIAPIAGTTITPALDDNRDFTDGIQLAITVHADGADVAGEPVMLTIGAPDGSPLPLAAPASDTDAGGASMASASFPPSATPAEYALVLVMRDHAGNVCTTTGTYDVVYTGCAIGVTSPVAPVTHDIDGASGNGLQADITLAVDPTCAGRMVTSTCGASSPNGIVDPGGSVTLRADICAISPCRTQVDCTFQVSNAIGIPTSASTTVVFDDQPPVTDFVAATMGRRQVQLKWTAPDHGVLGGSLPVAYLLKRSTAPLTDANFDTTGTVVTTVVPRAPGSPETITVSGLTSGVAQFFAIATVDAAGQRSAAALTGPIIPR